jgi:hypothetical protein
MLQNAFLYRSDHYNYLLYTLFSHNKLCVRALTFKHYTRNGYFLPVIKPAPLLFVYGLENPTPSHETVIFKRTTIGYPVAGEEPGSVSLFIHSLFTGTIWADNRFHNR